MTIADKTLMAHALGNLEPGDTMGLEEGLREDPTGRFRLSGLGFLADVSTPAAGALALEVEAPTLLNHGDVPPRAGDRTSLRLTPPVPAGDIHPVIWRESAGGRDLIYPSPGGHWTAMDRFRREGPDCVLDLVVAGPPGAQRYTLVLLPRDLFPTPWGSADPRWEGLWEAFRLGAVPGAQIELEVAA